MGAKSRLGVALLAAALAAGPLHAGEIDRLERFRALAANRLAAAQAVDGDRTAEVAAEIYALLDDEIVDSLSSGGVFASLPFLQDRLDGFAEAWGGAALRVTRVGDLTVGAFRLGDGVSGGSSVRVYGSGRQGAELLAVITRAGRPSVYPLPAAAGAAQFLVAWEGAPSGRGTRAFRIDLARERDGDVKVVWSTADVFPEGLVVREWRVRGGEVALRYEVRYPGWVPGCEPQTEQEDVYRLAPGSGTLVRVSRREHQPWHRALHGSVAAFFSALASGDHAALAALVPDARLRERLPPGLAPDPACDAPEPGVGAVPASVSVAARVGDTPWALTWRPAGARWRLTAAAPVLQ